MGFHQNEKKLFQSLDGYNKSSFSKVNENKKWVELDESDRDDEIRNVLPTPRIKYWHWPYNMGRVVMVKEALELLNIENNYEGSYTIKVNDSLASWNNKTFKLYCKDNKLIVSECDEPADFEFSIQRLSQLVFGHIGAKEAINMELITINTPSLIPLLINTFTKRTTMLWQAY